MAFVDQSVINILLTPEERWEYFTDSMIYVKWQVHIRKYE